MLTPHVEVVVDFPVDELSGEATAKVGLAGTDEPQRTEGDDEGGEKNKRAGESPATIRRSLELNHTSLLGLG